MARIGFQIRRGSAPGGKASKSGVAELMLRPGAVDTDPCLDAGARLLADVAEVTGLASGFGDALGGLRQRRPVHEPGRVAVDPGGDAG